MTLRFSRTILAATAAFALSSAALHAEMAEDELNINGDTPIVTKAPAAAHLEGHLDEVYSGWLFRTDDTRAMEQDDFDNPIMIYAEKGMDNWSVADGSEGKSCADCHGDISEGMKGVRATMPKLNAKGELWSMEDYINDCRTNRMGAEAWGWDSGAMHNMTVALSVQSRGMPVNVKIDGDAAPFWEKGKEIYYTRYGQLELSCASCHEENYGNYIRADHLSQGQIQGFPVYRLKNAGVVSIHNRFKGCIRDTRAETYSPGSPEFHALELYVASRGMGLDIEGGGVRP
ncbi:MAG: sulfur oxidation c-type cytochrome SoxA [Rhodobacteraceae bacterium]|jgi:diheme cytochrome SoxA (sulfur oxidation)|uniref:SoxAX cytochrome complex subunit A n=1 Tax=Thioclava marina TaxID=1915077 RepID=A0ABX3MMR4_9RHOB|nr:MULTISPECIES: sulfur oxidation c-type cytochrome SoxA [Thioclava]OOY12823.1 sulfur oxidation c-type cytochrome SoxA [Thioclava marina]OOY28047.1 sulfur oxidation c-type cytochrome SoxA [Thioclava sp. L04-15]TNE86812.1 MAG: sulfur oxidation c-type cytochrome SoxA [Paracoccaceae bacterium]TNF10176.1 MAG: sulfur oxidation c-type cytochrome SoxA [Paracoccaceae bacterium]